MDDTRIEKRVGARADSDRIWELVADLPHWSRWNPHDQAVEGTIAFGGRLAMTERWPDLPERRVAAQVVEWQPRVRLVWIEKRGFLFRTLRYIEIEELAPGSCILASGTRFTGLRAELFMDKHRSALRRGHEAIVEGLKSAAEA
jgi:hypothetical protein